MQLVFLNSLERATEEGRVKTAQVSITEHQGLWRVLWNEVMEDGHASQDCWFEGSHWQDLLRAYREGLKEKRGNGYIPLIDAASEEPWSPRHREVLALQYYGAKNRNDEVWQRLRQWRRDQAKQENKSAYFLATNRMLDMLSAFLPQSMDELRLIPGFGVRKVEGYGTAILEITCGYPRSIEFPLQWVSAAVSDEELQTWQIEQLRVREKQDVEKQAQRRRMLEALAEGAGISDLEERLGLKRQEVTRLVEELDLEGYDVTALVEAELSTKSEKESARIHALFQTMGDRFLKPVLQKLYSDEDLDRQDVGQLYEQLRLERIRYRHRPAVG